MLAYESLKQHRGWLTGMALTVWSGLLWAENTIPVRVTQPQVLTVTDTLSLSGTLTAEQHAMLSPRVDGLVAAVLVDAGSVVEKGQLLLKLDDSIARLAYAQAKAATAESRAARDEAARLVKEAESLRQKNYISSSESASRQSALSLAEAALGAATAAEKTAYEELQRHQLPAPFAGVVSKKSTEAGEWVDRGNAVLELVATESVWLDLQVPQERYTAVHVNSPVSVQPDLYPGETVPGNIAAIVPVSDPQARAFLVRVVLQATPLQLLPGTSATALIGLNGGANQKLSIPRDALLLHPDGGYSVFVVDAGIAKRRQVTVGQQSFSGVNILDGLKPEEQVVTRGNEVLRDGQSVTIKP